MHRAVASVGSAVWFLLAPGVVAGLIPWWLTGGRAMPRWSGWWPLTLVGVALLTGGIAVMLHSFARFAIEGAGTPAPVAPTERLVVGGLYRYVRNPMYVGLLATLLGQALALGQPVLLLYACVVGALSVSFVRWYEEPSLVRRFGAQYDAYRRAVPAWWPRRRPWRPDT